MATSTLTRKNQITLPAEIVRALDLAPGSQLAWSIGPDGTLIGTPQPDRAGATAACSISAAVRARMWPFCAGRGSTSRRPHYEPACR
ncbi:MAG: AbrB/MazE/SpoVT family DNA-binding domain-containing protein [Caldilineaceae bacterium]|nr:AbrB/MazE/SpoVT family DNA-binding domain-containing protein [Caldilineaceae bacterium]